MFYYFDIETLGEVQRHIMQQLPDDVIMTFPLTDSNPNKATYDAWVAEGNTAKPWPPKKTSTKI
jgi:hypothetical protein